MNVDEKTEASEAVAEEAASLLDTAGDAPASEGVDPGSVGEEMTGSAGDGGDVDEKELIKALQKELGDLKAELEEKRKAYDRLSAECAEFGELYPSVPFSSLPDEVWASMRSGVPLAAAYALAERRRVLAEEKAALASENAVRINRSNSEKSSPPISSGSREDYFSPDEVRAMSRDEVRVNYKKIVASMSKWH